MPRSATSIAPKEIALIRKAVETPSVAITTPASAGPTMRADCTIALFSPIAFTIRERPTSSTTKLCRVGLSTAFTAPRANTTAKTIQG